jgi:sugar phosphate isomerase/epimerase
MKFAFSSNAFLRFDLLETIKIVSSIGYTGIEIMADIPHAFPLDLTEAKIREIQTALRDNGLMVSNVNAFMHRADGDMYHPSWIEPDPALRAKRVDYTLRCLDLAAELGASNISTEPGGPLEGMTREEALRVYMEGLSAVESRAKENGIRVLIEPEPELLIENSGQFLELFRKLNPEAFGINFDVGHFFCVSEDPSDLMRTLTPMIHHFHLEDIAATRVHHHLQLGSGAIDLPNVLSTIEEIGYTGFVTVELYTYEDSAPDAALAAFKFLEKWTQSQSDQEID